MAKKILWTACLASSVALTGCANNEIGFGVNNTDKLNPAVSSTLSGTNTAIKAIVDGKHQIIVAGANTDKTYIIAWGSIANEKANIQNQNVALKGNSAFAEIGVTNVSKNIRFVRGGVANQNIKSVDLGITNQENQTKSNVENIGNTQRTTTTNTIKTEKSELKWGNTTTATIETGIKTSKNGTIILGAGQKVGNNPAIKNNTFGIVGYEHHFDGGSKIFADYRTDGYARAGVKTKITTNLDFSAGIGADTKNKNNSAFAGLTYSWGGANYSDRTNDWNSSNGQMLNRINSVDITDPRIAKNLSSQVKLSTTEQVEKLITVDEKIIENNQNNTNQKDEKVIENNQDNTNQKDKEEQKTAIPQENLTADKKPTLKIEETTLPPTIETLKYDPNNPEHNEYIDTYDLAVGQTEIITPGQDWTKTITTNQKTAIDKDGNIVLQTQESTEQITTPITKARIKRWLYDIMKDEVLNEFEKNELTKTAEQVWQKDDFYVTIPQWYILKDVIDTDENGNHINRNRWWLLLVAGNDKEIFISDFIDEIRYWIVIVEHEKTGTIRNLKVKYDFTIQP